MPVRARWRRSRPLKRSCTASPRVDDISSRTGALMNADDRASNQTDRNGVPAPSAVPVPQSGRAAFDLELGRVQDDVLVMGEHGRASDHSFDRRTTRSRCAASADELINRKRCQIEEEVIALIATQQPVAGELRRLTAGMSSSALRESMPRFSLVGEASTNVTCEIASSCSSGSGSMPALRR